MLLLFRFGSLSLLALAVFGAGVLLRRVSVPAAPRLGHRGAERRRAVEAGGVFATAEPLIRFVAGLVGGLPISGLREWQEAQLSRADHPLGLMPDEFSAICLLSALTMAGVAAGVCVSVGKSLVWVLPAMAFGLLLPVLQVREIIRERVKAISRGLPHSIEIAAMCMNAGLDFPGSLRLLIAQGTDRRDAMSREFSAILEELELGHTRTEALRSFARRVQCPAVRDFVNAVIQSEQKGNPLAQVIQIQGRMLNQRRTVAAEEAAARAGVMMMLPLVLLLGCVLLLLMGPFLAKGAGL